MGGGGKASGGGGDGLATQKLADISEKTFNMTSPLVKELITQGMTELQSGGIGTNIPLVQNAVESSKKSLSDTLAGIKESLATSGLADSPFGANILTGAKMSGEQGVNQTGNQAATWLLNSLPSFVLGAQGQGIQGMEGASRSQTAGYAADTQANAAKGTAYVQAMSQMMPKSPNCCFIFLAAEGVLDPVVRKYRNEFATVKMVRGYCRLADVLVPLMKKSKIVKYIIQYTMTKPLTCYGRFHYGYNKLGFIFYPVRNFWFSVFKHLGNIPYYIRHNTEEVV